MSLGRHSRHQKGSDVTEQLKGQQAQGSGGMKEMENTDLLTQSPAAGMAPGDRGHDKANEGTEICRKGPGCWLDLYQ